ncbi:MAG: O-antigen polysaccharide polymerase Wzy family protein [Propionibacteriaceae bacterium]|nr:O-antigen polysaccharide polymerase Wzy family protein [Propionibacteriaceae bacterium]
MMPTRYRVRGASRESCRHGVSRRPCSRCLWAMAGLLTGNLLLLALVLWSGCDWGWAAVLFLWLNLLLLCSGSGKPTAFFGGFLISFFVLLLSQSTLERVFGYSSGHYQPAGTRETTLILGVGLVTAAAAYFLPDTLRQAPLIRAAARIGRQLRGQRPGAAHRERWAGRPWGGHADDVRSACLTIMIAAFPPSVFWLSSRILGAGIANYQSLYVTESIEQGGGFTQTVGMYCAAIAVAAFLVFLATLPPRRAVVLPVALLAIIQGLYLMTGVRREFTVFIIVLACYLVARHRLDPGEGWITRRTVVVGTLGAAGLVGLFTAVENLRGLGSSSSAVSFLYNQGVSIRVIDNVVRYGDQLPEQFYLAPFAHSGIVGRLLGLPTLQGNSLLRAEIGGSLSHSLSRLVLGERSYLSGVTTGTSYLAEGYLQYGLIGVVAVSLAAGLALRYVDGLGGGSLTANALRMLIVPALIWMPRGPATEFIGTLVAVPTILAIGMVGGLALMFRAIQHHRYPLTAARVGPS